MLLLRTRMYRMLYESKLEQDTTSSLSAIKPMSQSDEGTSAGVLYEDYIKLAQDVGGNADYLADPVTMDTTKFGTLFSKRMMQPVKSLI